LGGERKTLFSCAADVLPSVLAWGQSAIPSQKEFDMVHEPKQATEMQTCIEDCRECWSRCTETLQHCLTKGGRHVGAGHIRLLLDCADICRTFADFMLRGSELYPQVCEV
jgi:hypothetical protein